MSSWEPRHPEGTAAIIDKVAKVRHDPFAMIPFCGYHMGDYFQHWFEMGDRMGAKTPRIFYVNWFRKGDDGRWLWPGFGDNSRVLKWMCERVDGKVGASETSIGLMPKLEDLDLSGLSVSPQDMEELLRVDSHSWKAEYFDIEAFFDQFGSHLPERLKTQLENFKKRLIRF